VLLIVSIAFIFESSWGFTWLKLTQAVCSNWGYKCWYWHKCCVHWHYF